jgi:ABC-type oligopeptide transport system substrate-binding subunit
VDFDPAGRIELERNPSYWREGLPRAEGLVFHSGVEPATIRRDFEAGRYAIAADLLPADAEALRRDARFASGYRESPRLLTYLLAFNVHRPPFDDPNVRRAVQESLDVHGLVRRTMGRLAIPADGLIPPGLLGHGARSAPRSRPAGKAPDETLAQQAVELATLVHPIFLGEYAGFAREIAKSLREMGFVMKIANRTLAEMADMRRRGAGELYIARWDADYPDADSFVRGLLHRRQGILGGFCGSPEIDELAERGASEMDPRARDAVYRQVEEILARDALLVPLFHEQVYRFGRPELEGLRVGFSAPAVAYETLSLRR